MAVVGDLRRSRVSGPWPAEFGQEATFAIAEAVPFRRPLRIRRWSIAGNFRWPVCQPLLSLARSLLNCWSTPNTRRL